MNTAGKKELDKISEFLATYMHGMSNSELANLRVYCGEVTNTNCWWFSKELSAPIDEMAKAIREVRGDE